jgi:hypothetical protein
MPLEHLKEGYKNGQETIRFIDTKTAVTAGFAMAFMGGVMMGFSEFLFADDMKQGQIIQFILRINCCSCPVILLVIASIAAGLSAIICATMSIVARPPSVGGPKVTVLFPYFDGSPEVAYHYRQIIRSVGRPTEEEIRAEYENQIISIGEILRLKFFWHRCSVWSLLTQNILLVAAGILIILKTTL